MNIDELNSKTGDYANFEDAIEDVHKILRFHTKGITQIGEKLIATIEYYNKEMSAMKTQIYKLEETIKQIKQEGSSK